MGKVQKIKPDDLNAFLCLSSRVHILYVLAHSHDVIKKTWLFDIWYFVKMVKNKKPTQEKKVYWITYDIQGNLSGTGKDSTLQQLPFSCMESSNVSQEKGHSVPLRSREYYTRGRNAFFIWEFKTTIAKFANLIPPHAMSSFQGLTYEQ